MSDMLKEFVGRELDGKIRDEYPHVKYPSGMYAKVVKCCKGEKLYKYTLKILDKSMQPNNDFPEIPNVKSSIQLNEGETVVILLLYGGSDILILGRRDQ